MAKLTLPEVVPRFRRYYEHNPSWGVFHIVLDDDNHSDSCARYCLFLASESGDTETIALAHLLQRLSRTQRGKLARLVRSV